MCRVGVICLQVTETNPTKFRQKTIKNKGGAGEGRVESVGPHRAAVPLSGDGRVVDWSEPWNALPLPLQLQVQTEPCTSKETVSRYQPKTAMDGRGEEEPLSFDVVPGSQSLQGHTMARGHTRSCGNLQHAGCYRDRQLLGSPWEARTYLSSATCTQASYSFPDTCTAKQCSFPMNLAYQDSYQFSLIPPHAHPHRAIDETLSQGKKKQKKKIS